MEENVFDKWNCKKKRTHFEGQCPHLSVGDIWWAQLGQNIATEVIGKGEDFLRPVLVLQVVYGNSCLVIPLTSKSRKGDYYFSFIDSKRNFQCGLLTQVRYLDGRRLKYQQSKINKRDFNVLRNAFISLIKK